ncbi:MAG: epimerase [Dehalococcoidia bacterium]
MRLLIIGGTVFLGRHIVEAALAAGHEITIFHRGRSNPGLFDARVREVLGDRDGDLAAVGSGPWDCVIDTCGYVPRVVAQSASHFGPAASRYVFISTISVFEGHPAGANEDSPLAQLADPTTEDVTGDSYGPLKALCEAAAEAAMPGRVLTIRPGLIVGPNDPSDRFTYWPVRVARGGAVLAPNGPQVPVQVIDVRDLASWTVAMVERAATGIYLATGPAYPLTLGEVLDTCASALGTSPAITWAPEPFLAANAVVPFHDLPLWVPEAQSGMNQADCSKAIAAGLTFRPLCETITDTLAWYSARPTGPSLRAGLPPDREAELLRLLGGTSPLAPA